MQIAILQPREAKIQAEITDNSKLIKDAEKELKNIKKT